MAVGGTGAITLISFNRDAKDRKSSSRDAGVRRLILRKWGTDLRTDGRTDTPSYRDARTHLIMIGDCLRVIWSE